MASTTLLFGILLTVLGLAGYALTGGASVTALIPALFGLALVGLGLVARKEHLRKHAMHAAAAVALLGFAGAVFPFFRGITAGRTDLAVLSQGAMVVLTGVFVALCVKSFIDARRSRVA
jgi:hypothetical protein